MGVLASGPQAPERFGFRYLVDALIAAQTELVKLREKEWAGKFKKAKVKLAKAKTAQSKAGLTAKVAKRERRWLYWHRHLQAGTHPPVIFGGRKLFYERCAGKSSAAEWKESRSGRLVSRGDKTKGGNLNLRLIPGGPGGALLEVALPNGNRTAPRVQLAVYLPRKVSKTTGAIHGTDYRTMVLDYMVTGKAYQVELVRREGKIYCHITLEEPVPAARQTQRYLGVDTNPAGLAATLVLADGNFKQSWWLGDGELTYARINRRRNRVGELAASLVDLARQQQATIVVEDLKFVDDREVNAKFHRLAHQFIYRGLLQAILRRALRQGVPIQRVHPAYTSAIGGLKYAHQYRLVIHNAAAMVLARRAMGLKERVPKALQGLLLSSPATEWKAWAALKKAARSHLKLRGVNSLVSWPMHRKEALGLTVQSI